MAVCPQCGGAGMIRFLVGYDQFGHPIYVWHTCPVCRGMGSI